MADVVVNPEHVIASDASDRRKVLTDLCDLFRYGYEDDDNNPIYTVSVEIGVCSLENIARNSLPVIQIIDGRESNRIVNTAGIVTYTLQPIIRLIDIIDDSPAGRAIKEPHVKLDEHIQRIKGIHDTNQSFGDCSIWRMPTIETIYDASGYLAEVYFESQLDVYTSYTS